MRAIEAPLSALAEALWPSVPGAAAAAAAAGDLGLSAYYRLSGSYCPGVVDQAMHAIDRYVHGGNKTSLILFLSLLNFRLGTLLLCGATCITAQFPFVYAFPQLPVARRELIFQRWQVSRLGELQKAAKAIKSIVLSSIFSYHSFSDDGNGRGSAANGSAAAANPPDAVSNGAGDASANAKSGAMPPAAAALPQNPFWETIGYVPGPAAPRLPPHPNQAAAEAALAAAVIDLAAPPTGALPAAAASETPGSSSSGNGAADADSAIDGRGADRAVTSRQRLLRAWLQSRGLACSESLQASEIAASHGADCVVEADAVVIGSGAGGGVAAAMLAASGLRRVIMVEKGGWLPGASLQQLEREACAEMYENAAMLATEDGAVNVLAGATLGGGTKVNWAAALRTPVHVKREWADCCGLPHFAGPRFEAALDAVCGRMGVTNDYRHNAPNALLKAGLQALGCQVGDYPRNCHSPEACSALCGMGCRSGHKQSTDVTFLADAARDGARILVHAAAECILTADVPEEGTRRGRRHVAQGLVVRATAPALPSDDTHCTAPPIKLVVKASLVVLAAGALHSPALLLRSGIACGGNVGANLKLHPATVMVARYPRGGAPPAQAEQLHGESTPRSGPVGSPTAAAAAAAAGSDSGSASGGDADAGVTIVGGAGAAGAGCAANGAVVTAEGAGGASASGAGASPSAAGAVMQWRGAMMSAVSRELADWECAAGAAHGSASTSTAATAAAANGPTATATATASNNAAPASTPSPAPASSFNAACATGGRAAGMAPPTEGRTPGYGPLLSVPIAQPGLIAAGFPWHSGADMKWRFTQLPDAALTLVFARDRDGGRVTADAAGRPVLHYWPSAHDRESMVRGIELALRAALAAGAVEMFSIHLDDPGYRVDENHSPAAFEAYLASVRARGIQKYKMTVLTAHQMGTCRMGTSPKDSVCDAAGECWEVAGLHIADASAFPTASGANPMVTCEALAYCVAQDAAQLWREDRETCGGGFSGRGRRRKSD